ncbi:hypothetical protein ED733_001275 [Metarhizium rileyi]|uniref:Uncharacterized protein n=1 Tax=Metarhizium rileyi (strain RCEF 4871) TaxID=1649241 RepID=A0A5C6G418_METRR|nr:hypothetical protein ED733_001275 [Metarhizium rileyi]
MSRAASPSRTLSAPTKPHKGWHTSAIGSIALLAKRDNICGDNLHNCLDISQPQQCCDDQSYCYINKYNEARCCPIGSNCIADSLCKSDYYYCTTVLSSVTVGNSTTQGCCGRKCPQTSYYLCPSDLGGKCCPYGSNCQAGGNCIMKQTPSTTTRVPSSGPGTCSTCTPTGADNVTVIEVDHLSSGAKAGIGVGVALGTSLLIALLAWSYILYRRHRRQKDHGEKFPDAANLSELVGTGTPLDPAGRNAPATATATRDQAATERSESTDPNAEPVEMASTQASPPDREPSTSPWENANVETIDGLFELDASQVHAPPASPPPEPNVYFPSHLGSNVTN